MKKITTDDQDKLGIWFAENQPDRPDYCPGEGQYIGLTNRFNHLIAVVMFEGYNGANINMHISAKGKHWLTRDFLWYSFHYPFNELKCKRITGIVPETNLLAKKFDEHLGFVLEAKLKDAHPTGDLLLYCMTKENCRWINLKENGNGQV